MRGVVVEAFSSKSTSVHVFFLIKVCKAWEDAGKVLLERYFTHIYLWPPGYLCIYKNSTLINGQWQQEIFFL